MTHEQNQEIVRLRKILLDHGKTPHERKIAQQKIMELLEIREENKKCGSG